MNNIDLMRVKSIKISEKRFKESPNCKAFTSYEIRVFNEKDNETIVNLYTNSEIGWFNELDEIIVDLEANSGCSLEDIQCSIQDNVKRLKALVTSE